MRSSVLLVGVLGIAACAVEPEPELDVGSTPKLSANALSPSSLPYSLLTTGVLDSTSAAAMAPSAEPREVLHYAVQCALPADQSLTYRVDGLDYLVTGSIGMAPGWTTSGLSATEAAWLSACVLSRVNLNGTTVPISDRGTNAGLATTSTELSGYQVQEGAFWGNVFVDRGAFTGNACNGVDQAANDSYGDLPLRQCAQWDGVAGSNLTPCGFHYAGLCTSVCASTGPYGGCSFQGGSQMAEVVTTYLYGAPQ